MITTNTSDRIKRWLVRALIVVVVLVGLILAFTTFHVADIRPTELKNGQITEGKASKGKEILLRAANKHGKQKWNLNNNLEIIGIDDWFNWMGDVFINPFPNARQKIKLQMLLGTWTSRLELLDVSRVTEVWGIQSWNTYRSQVGQKPDFQPDKEIRFFLPTFQWWFEFPFRIISASVISALSESQSSKFDRVFVTWGSLEPNRELDQYIIYINKQTGLINRIEYTIRDMGGFATGATNFIDYQLVDGVMVPFQLEAAVIMPGGFEQVMHRVTVESACWNTITPDRLLPNPDFMSEKESKL
jgi:hypothetical protein